jgi:galactose mutarotase-like enzyme
MAMGGGPHLEEVAVDGFAGLCMSNGRVSLTIVPELGGKIVNLVNLSTGRNWLQSNPHLPLARHSYGSSYLRDGDSGGWDECFPTVAECPMPGNETITVPDHGELWAKPWSVRGAAVDELGAQLLLSSQGQIADYSFNRRIELPADSSEVRVHYEVHSRASANMPFIWSAHPILDLRPGSTIELPSGLKFALHIAIPPIQSSDDSAVDLPLQQRVEGRRLILGPLPDKNVRQAFKVWATELPEGWARLVDPDGDCIEFRFDPTELPNLGLWVNLGGWAGRPEWQERYYCVAIEPCIGAQDRLDDAVKKYNQYGILEAGKMRSWSLAVDLDGRRTNGTGR